MSTAPTGWQNPKTNWQAPDVPLSGDFNRIEGNINAIEQGNRTIDPAQVPTGNVGSLRQLLDWFANRIKAITGKANWYDAPSITLEAISTQIVPAASVYNSTDPSIPNITTSPVSFDSEFFDTNSMHDPVTNNSRLTCKTAGIYIVTAKGEYDSGVTTGNRVLYIYKNGIFNAGHGHPGTSFDLTITNILQLNVNDYVEMWTYQNSGGALILKKPVLSMVKIA